MIAFNPASVTGFRDAEFKGVFPACRLIFAGLEFFTLKLGLKTVNLP